MCSTRFGVGLTLPQLGEHVTREAVRAFCQRAEALGFASLWAQEHLFFALEPSAPYAARPGMPVPEAYKTTWSPLELLTAAAAWTERVAHRHRHPRRWLPPPGRARPAAGHARPPVERAPDRRAQRRLVEGRARPDGRRVRDPRGAHGRTGPRHSPRAGDPTRCGSTASSSTSPTRSSARSRCSGRTRRCCPGCAPPPGCAARRRCSTCGTRPRARSSRSRRPRPRSTPCAPDARRRSRSCNGCSRNRRSSCQGSSR